MAEVARVTAVLDGFTGGPGIATFHFGVAVPPFNGAAAQLAVDRVRDAYTAAAMLFIQSFRATIGPEVEILDEATGTITGVLNATQRQVAGGNSNNQEAPRAVGLLTTYGTAGVVHGHRVKGRTFHVPVSYYAFDTDGTPTSTAVGLALAFGTSMLDAGTNDCVFGIYSRPYAGKPGNPARTGSFHGATTHGAPDMGVVLRSRRD